MFYSSTLKWDKKDNISVTFTKACDACFKGQTLVQKPYEIEENELQTQKRRREMPSNILEGRTKKKKVKRNASLRKPVCFLFNFLVVANKTWCFFSLCVVCCLNIWMYFTAVRICQRYHITWFFFFLSFLHFLFVSLFCSWTAISFVQKTESKWWIWYYAYFLYFYC